MGVNDPMKGESGHGGRSLDAEKVAWRVKLRKESYLTTPNEQSMHKSLDGEVLDESLINITLLGKHNETDYLIAAKNNLKANLQPIFVTKQERDKFEDIKNKTKETIVSMTMEMLETFPVELQDEYLSIYNRSVKGKKKDVLLEFYLQVKDLLATQSHAQTEYDPSITPDQIMEE